MSRRHDPAPIGATALTKLEERQALNAALEWVLDALPIGYVLVQADARVVKANRLARAILEEERGLRVRAGILEACDPEQSGVALAAAIRCASGGHGAQPPVGIVRVRRRHGRPVSAIVVGVQSSIHPAHPISLAAVLVAEGDAGIEQSRHLLRELYDLTPREVDIAAGLLHGYAVGEIARRLGVSVHTVRTHVKHLLAKTRTTAQPELVRVLLASFPPIHLP